MMVSSHLLFGLFAAASLVQSLPARRDGQGFSGQCTDLQLKGQWLVGNCPTGQGNDERIVSAVYLATSIANDNGVLKWAKNGKYQQACQQCSLTDSKSLSCECQPNGTGLKSTSLNLEEHITNQGGHLLVSMDGLDKKTPTNSQVQVPLDFNFSLPLGTEQNCNPGLSVSNTMPLDCYTFAITAATNMTYLSGQFNDGRYWKAEVYASETCEGQPLARFQEADNGQCKNFQSKGVGIKVTPLFNADW